MKDFLEYFYLKKATAKISIAIILCFIIFAIAMSGCQKQTVEDSTAPTDSAQSTEAPENTPLSTENQTASEDKIEEATEKTTTEETTTEETTTEETTTEETTTEEITTEETTTEETTTEETTIEETTTEETTTKETITEVIITEAPTEEISEAQTVRNPRPHLKNPASGHFGDDAAPSLP